MIITSATIDTARFSAHFDEAPIVEVSGRSYPVEVRYRPLADPEDPTGDELEQAEGIVTAVEELRAEGARRRPGLLFQVNAIPGTPPRRWPPRNGRRPRSCRYIRVCRPPSSSASSLRTPDAGSCWPPTSPRRR